MDDKKFLKLLNEFANEHTLATNIKVEITPYCKSFTPRNPGSFAKYEDANLLASIIAGAESFCYFLQRHGYILHKKGDK